MQTVVLWILKGLFLPLSIVHVYSCFADRMALRRGTKPFLLLTLAAIYLLGARVFHPLVFAALLCGFAGDSLLIFSDGNRRFFFLGAAAFAAGHVLYLAALFDLVSLRHNALLLLRYSSNNLNQLARRVLCGGDCGDGGMLCLYAFAFPRHCFGTAFLRYAVFFGERQLARFLHISAKRGKTMAGRRCDVQLHCRANTALHWLFSLGDS